MKLAVAPPFRPLQKPAAPAAPAEGQAPDPPGRPLDLAARFDFGASSIDEAAVVLVELSTLVYRRLPAVLEALDRTSLSQIDLIDRHGSRAADVARWRTARAAFESASPFAAPPSPVPKPFRLEDTLAWKAMQARGQDLSSASTPPDLGTLSTPTLSRAAALLPAPAPSSASAQPRDWAAPARLLVAVHDGSALVVFRGTQGAGDWLIDGMCWPARRWPLRHAGFERTWQALKAPLLAWLRQVEAQTGQRPALYLGGHSLGGALATLAAGDLADAGYPIARVVTMGCPRVGGWRHRQRYRARPAAPSGDGAQRSLESVTTRFVHGLDIVAAWLPPPLVTAHTTPAFRLQPKDRLDLHEYLDSPGLPQPGALVGSWIGSIERPLKLPGSIPDGAHDGRRRLRRSVAELAKWVLLSAETPGVWKALAVGVPLATELVVRSGMAHRSQRYLGFMPPSAIYRAMFLGEPPGAATTAAEPLRPAARG